MGAFEAVSFSALPPVRRPVPLRGGRAPAVRSALIEFFGGRQARLYASGTASLSQAIAQSAARHPTRSPEVILPAYGCPDLVAACVHASVRPRLVDIAPSGWKYDPDRLNSSISPDTVAVVAVNLLGVGDDAAALRRTCDERHVSLIQDSAQYLPRERCEWPGHYVVLSFGRGKPMNLLYGGALIGDREAGDQPSPAAPRFPWGARLRSSRAAALAFNTLTRPLAYGVISKLPGTGFGDVVYKPLGDADPLPEHAWPRVDAAFASYCLQASYSRRVWEPVVEEWRQIGIDPLQCPSSSTSTEPLRLALLAPDRASRDELVERFAGRGLGPSRFYGLPLVSLPGIPDMVRQQGPFPHARSLADRLFTLPTHQLVTTESVTCARSIVAEWRQISRAMSQL